MSPDDIRTGKNFATVQLIVKAMTFVSIYAMLPCMPTPEQGLASAGRCSITIRLSNNNQ
jgi:hypothetical protein